MGDPGPTLGRSTAHAGTQGRLDAVNAIHTQAPGRGVEAEGTQLSEGYTEGPWPGGRAGLG